MMRDIEKGKINTVIVKDLSRFGREHIMVDYYTQVYFPEENIRFIAILNGTDINRKTVANYDMPMIITSVFNEFHPADTSMKVRQAIATKASHGEFMGSKAPYGYIKSPQDKHVLIVDEEYAPIVKRIFEMAAYEGMGFQKIANKLYTDRVLTPSALETKRRGKLFEGDPYLWNLETVRKIINNKIYIGTLVSGQRRKLSFKSKKIIKCDEEEWIVVENVCEPIVSKVLWNDAQLRIKDRKIAKKEILRHENIFAGLLKCAECGRAMRVSSTSVRRTYYACGGYRKPKANVQCCTMHYVLYDDIYKAVLNDTNAMLRMLDEDEEGFRKLVRAKMNADAIGTMDRIESEISSLEKEVEHLKHMYKQLYNDKLKGEISREMFLEMSADCERERAESEKRLAFLHEKAAAEAERTKGADEFLKLLGQYKPLNALDKEVLNRLIEKITISETWDDEGKKQLTITIYYKFLGKCAL